MNNPIQFNNDAYHYNDYLDQWLPSKHDNKKKCFYCDESTDTFYEFNNERVFCVYCLRRTKKSWQDIKNGIPFDKWVTL
jgi:hypothetical protein